MYQLRSGAYPTSTWSPSIYPVQQSPSTASPSASTPKTQQHAESPQRVSSTHPARASLVHGPTYRSPPIIHSTQSVPTEEVHPHPDLSTTQNIDIHHDPHPQPSFLPLFESSIQTMGPPVSPRQPYWQSSDPNSDEHDNGELGFLAPWEVRGLADSDVVITPAGGPTSFFPISAQWQEAVGSCLSSNQVIFFSILLHISCFYTNYTQASSDGEIHLDTPFSRLLG